MENYKPKEFAELLNVSLKTLQHEGDEGILIAHQNPKGRRCYMQAQSKVYQTLDKR